MKIAHILGTLLLTFLIGSLLFFIGRYFFFMGVGYLAIFVYLLPYCVIRCYYRYKQRSTKVVENRRDLTDVITMCCAMMGSFFPIILLNFPLLENTMGGGYRIPHFLALLGSIIYAASLLLLWRSHADLSLNWSGTMKIKEGHSLIQRGVYKHARHPMYTSFILMGFSSVFMVPNFYQFLCPASILLSLLVRIPKEEKMMRDSFGKTYDSYMKDTSRFIPIALHEK